MMARIEKLGRFPASELTTPQRPKRNAKNACPFAEMKSLALISNFANIAFVLRLLKPTGPSAIGCPGVFLALFAVAAAITGRIIDSVKCSMRWAWTHVSKEMMKRFSPALTNSNPASTIVAIVSSFGLIATTQHVAITTEFRSLSQLIHIPAGALIARTDNQIFRNRSYRAGLTAAFANPRSEILACYSGGAKNRPTSECRPGKVSNWCSHTGLYACGLLLRKYGG